MISFIRSPFVFSSLIEIIKMFKEETLAIEPRKGLGIFRLETGINQILVEIKSKGHEYQRVEIVVSETSINEPIFIIIPKEGLKLRFDPVFQKLELIEVNCLPLENRYHSLMYKGNIILNPNLKSVITYNYINSLFGPANMPKLIDDNKHLLLRYEGISFMFENNGVENEDAVILGSEARLEKILIFGEKLLKDSLSGDVLCNAPTVKIEVDKGISVSTSEDDESVNINFDEALESVLNKLKNPNYIYYKSQSSEEYDSLEYRSDNETGYSSPDYFLNYFNYGFDLMFDGEKNIVKKIKLHSNNYFSSSFGVYERCNFVMEFHRNFFKKAFENNPFPTNLDNPSSRKISDDSSLYKTIDEGSFDNSQANDNYHKEEISQKEGTLSNGNTEKKQAGTNTNEKSISLNESFASSLNNSGGLANIIITPTTNFSDFILKVPGGCYNTYVMTDLKIKSASKFYAFESFNVEVVENGSIASILLYKSQLDK